MNEKEHWKGEASQLHEALDAAWNKAKHETQARTFEVTSIVIECENPIRTYIVTIEPVG